MKRLPDQDSNLHELEVFSRVNFVVTDIDGTLIKEKSNVYTQFSGSFMASHHKVKMTIATGRTLRGTEKIAQELNIKTGMPMALYNGAVILAYKTNEILWRKTIPRKFVAELREYLDLLNERFLVYTLETCTDAVSGIEQPIIEKVYGFGKQNMTYDVNGAQIIWADDIPTDCVDPCAILIDKCSFTKQRNDEITKFLDNQDFVDYTFSGTNYIEIHARGTNKGQIFEVIKDTNKYLINKSLAIGDNDNDYELLSAADIGVAVANASERAKDIADYVCWHNGAAGVLDVIEIIKTSLRYFGGAK